MPLQGNLMTNTPPPVYRTGKICYLEIPATDISEAADFHHQAFGWSIRRDSDGAVAFDDTVGGVSGMWVGGDRAGDRARPDGVGDDRGRHGCRG
jgi:hypothetical protein